MSEDAPVRPDQVSLGVLVTAVPRDAVDDAVAACGVACGVAQRRAGGKLPPHVVAYFAMGMCLFAEDDYTEVATRVTGALSAWGCWDASWSVPTSGGISQARARLGSRVLAETFERVAAPVATADTRGAWLRGWRLLAIDGFDVGLPDTAGNAAEFGYAGTAAGRSAFPKARVAALAECGTHAVLAAEVAPYSTGEQTLARRLYQRLRPDELLTADRGFYSFQAWQLATRTGAGLAWRAPTQLNLPVLAVLGDGTFLSVLINPRIRGARRRAGLTEQARADELAAGYDQRWEEETGNDQLKTHLRGPGRVLRSRLPDLAYQEIWAWLLVHYALSALAARAAEAADLDPDRISFSRVLRNRPPLRHRDGGFFPLTNGTPPCRRCWPRSPASSPHPGGTAPARARSNAPDTTATGSNAPARPPPATPDQPPSTSTPSTPEPHDQLKLSGIASKPGVTFWPGTSLAGTRLLARPCCV